MIVVDASAKVEVLAGTASALVARLVFDPAQSLHAPHLLDVEIAQVLRRWCARGLVDPVRAEEALADLAALPLRRHAQDVLWPRVWSLRHNLTAYDATYVALAELLEAPLLTLDRRLATAAGHRAQVILA